MYYSVKLIHVRVHVQIKLFNYIFYWIPYHHIYKTLHLIIFNKANQKNFKLITRYKASILISHPNNIIYNMRSDLLFLSLYPRRLFRTGIYEHRGRDTMVWGEFQSRKYHVLNVHFLPSVVLCRAKDAVVCIVKDYEVFSILSPFASFCSREMGLLSCGCRWALFRKYRHTSKHIYRHINMRGSWNIALFKIR